jgi:hypothetical protein
MTAVTFDTLKQLERLKAAGISDAHAKAEVEMLVEALAETTHVALASKQDVSELKSEMLIVKSELKAELFVVKWMLGVMVAGIGALIVKSFF